MPKGLLKYDIEKPMFSFTGPIRDIAFFKKLETDTLKTATHNIYSHPFFTTYTSIQGSLLYALFTIP
jgi:hypothetical protein